MVRHLEDGFDRISIMWVMDGYVLLTSSKELTDNELIKLGDCLVKEEYIS